ncbi:MAG: type 4a pilus biogenesis protein PilO [Bdellovibrionota bacterium]
MNELLEKIIELPMAARGAILGVFAAVIIGLYYIMFFGPVSEQLATMDADTKRIKDEVALKTRIVSQLPKFLAEVERLDVELKKALAELPDNKEIAQLLEKVADKAKESGLDVHLFRPKAEQRRDFYAEVPVEIEVGGGYHQVATFFDEVSHLERIVNIDQFSMVEPKRGETGLNLKTSLVATSFRFLDESERPKEDAAGAKHRRKKPAAAAGKDAKDE